MSIRFYCWQYYNFEFWCLITYFIFRYQKPSNQLLLKIQYIFYMDELTNTPDDFIVKNLIFFCWFYLSLNQINKIYCVLLYTNSTLFVVIWLSDIKIKIITILFDFLGCPDRYNFWNWPINLICQHIRLYNIRLLWLESSPSLRKM